MESFRDGKCCPFFSKVEHMNEIFDCFHIGTCTVHVCDLFRQFESKVAKKNQVPYFQRNMPDFDKEGKYLKT